jgi:hypothetical protein
VQDILLNPKGSFNASVDQWLSFLSSFSKRTLEWGEEGCGSTEKDGGGRRGSLQYSMMTPPCKEAFSNSWTLSIGIKKTSSIL